jgi:hypothetical protein
MTDWYVYPVSLEITLTAPTRYGMRKPTNLFPLITAQCAPSLVLYLCQCTQRYHHNT